MVLVKLSQHHTQYLIYNTGYTSRLAKNNEFICYSFEELLDIFNNNSSLHKTVEEGELTENTPSGEFLKEDNSKMKLFFEENKTFQTTEKEERDESIFDTEEDDFKRSMPVFIFDNLWGMGFYLHKSINPKDHINNIFKVHSMMIADGDSSGYITFINDTIGFDYIKWLTDQDYCCLHGHLNPEVSLIFDSETKFGITIVDIDGESG